MRQILAILLCLTLAGRTAMTAHADESTLDFFKGLNFDDGRILTSSSAYAIRKA